MKNSFSEIMRSGMADSELVPIAVKGFLWSIVFSLAFLRFTYHSNETWITFSLFTRFFKFRFGWIEMHGLDALRYSLNLCWSITGEAWSVANPDVDLIINKQISILGFDVLAIHYWLHILVNILRLIVLNKAILVLFKSHKIESIIRIICNVFSW